MGTGKEYGERILEFGGIGETIWNLVQWKLPEVYKGYPSNEGYGALTSHLL